MRQRVVCLVVVVCLVCAFPLESYAGGIAVFDAAVFGNAIQQLAQTYQMLNLAIKDLAPLAQIGRVLQVLRDLQTVIDRITVIANKMRGRRTLWGAAYPIHTVRELAGFTAWADELCQEVNQNAFEAQDLLFDALLLVHGIMALLDSIGAIVGTVAGLQTANGHLGAMAGVLTMLQAMTAAANEASLCTEWRQVIQRQAAWQIHRNLVQRSFQWLDRR